MLDAQSVRAADTGAASSRGSNAGKKVNGRKRHIVVDTLGLLLMVMVSTAGAQDPDGATNDVGPRDSNPVPAD